jgi:hypothetical protein
MGLSVKAFLLRIYIVLLSGYIIVYYGELVFWATPEREGMTIGGIAVTWLVYSLFAYVFLCVVNVFRVRSPWAVFLAGAFYGWFEEGIVVQTMYGTQDGPFPMSIAFTGLAWHALIGIFTGWYLVPKVLSENRMLKTAGLATMIGLFYGLWAISWLNEPPPPMKLLLDSGQKNILLSHFAIYTFLTTAFLILIHCLYNRAMPFVFQPSKIELWFLGAATGLYFIFVTIPTAPKAVWVLPPLMAITFWALNKNRRTESRADAISCFDQSVRPANYLTLGIIPLFATSIYFLALETGTSLRINQFVYYCFSAAGAFMWIFSCVVLFGKAPKQLNSRQCA